jgi:DDE superfamily endonuclease
MVPARPFFIGNPGWVRSTRRARFKPSIVLEGKVTGRCMARHRHQEFIHAVVDNNATHKHPKVREWLARHPRWTFHFTPTSASWLNRGRGLLRQAPRMSVGNIIKEFVNCRLKPQGMPLQIELRSSHRHDEQY